MRKITSALNHELTTLTRPGPKPELDPMTIEELREIEKHLEITLSEPLLIKPEEEKAKEHLKEIDKAAKTLWMKVMKVGAKGIPMEDLTEYSVEEGITPALAKAAVERLEEMGQIGKIGWDRIVAIASVQTPHTTIKPERDVYELMVEKIYPGNAVVLINDKWRARLAHEDFEGPSSLVKKNARFKARGTLYHDDGTLCFRVQEVTEILS
jgi:Fanconi anemia group M protein